MPDRIGLFGQFQFFPLEQMEQNRSLAVRISVTEPTTMVKDPIQRGTPGSPHAEQPLLSDFHDDADMRPIVLMFISEIPGRMESLRKTLELEDRAAFRRLVHQIKGAGGGYGFQPISEAAARLERCLDVAGAQWSRECHAHLDTLLTVLRRAHAGLADLSQ